MAVPIWRWYRRSSGGLPLDWLLPDSSVVLRERALMLRYGDLETAYLAMQPGQAARTVFRPSLAARASAQRARNRARRIGDSMGDQIDRWHADGPRRVHAERPGARTRGSFSATRCSAPFATCWREATRDRHVAAAHDRSTRARSAAAGARGHDVAGSSPTTRACSFWIWATPSISPTAIIRSMRCTWVWTAIASSRPRFVDPVRAMSDRLCRNERITRVAAGDDGARCRHSVRAGRCRAGASAAGDQRPRHDGVRWAGRDQSRAARI